MFEKEITYMRNNIKISEISLISTIIGSNKYYCNEIDLHAEYNAMIHTKFKYRVL